MPGCAAASPYRELVAGPNGSAKATCSVRFGTPRSAARLVFAHRKPCRKDSKRCTGEMLFRRWRRPIVKFARDHRGHDRLWLLFPPDPAITRRASLSWPPSFAEFHPSSSARQSKIQAMVLAIAWSSNAGTRFSATPWSATRPCSLARQLFPPANCTASPRRRVSDARDSDRSWCVEPNGG